MKMILMAHRGGVEFGPENLPSTLDEQLRRRKPDLRDRFVKGALASRSSVTNGLAGGSNNLRPHTHRLETVSASNVVSQTPHTHGVNDPGHSHSYNGYYANIWNLGGDAVVKSRDYWDWSLPDPYVIVR